MGLCYYCAHLGDNNDADQMTCAAYPGGIPDLIIQGKRDHRTRLPGDNGVTFEPSDTTTPDMLEGVYKMLP
jgi:hypothetical protein